MVKANELEKPELIMMVGLPASGKSTKVQELLQKNPEKNYVVLSTDDILMSMGDGQTYDEIKDAHYNKISQKKIISKFNNDLRQAINQKRNIIVDRTNMGMKARRKILSPLTRDYVTTAYVWQLSRDEIDRRMAARAKEIGKTIPPKTVDQMADSFVMPSKSEFNKIVRM